MAYFLQHCALCQNGGKLWVCDEENCEQAICSSCIDVPDAELSKLEHLNVKFTYIPCHWRKCRDESLIYFVSAFCFFSYLCQYICLFL
jgi:hypothetical protein